MPRKLVHSQHRQCVPVRHVRRRRAKVLPRGDVQGREGATQVRSGFATWGDPQHSSRPWQGHLVTGASDNGQEIATVSATAWSSENTNRPQHGHGRMGGRRLRRVRLVGVPDERRVLGTANGAPGPAKAHLSEAWGSGVHCKQVWLCPDPGRRVTAAACRLGLTGIFLL